MKLMHLRECCCGGDKMLNHISNCCGGMTSAKFFIKQSVSCIQATRRERRQPYYLSNIAGRLTSTLLPYIPLQCFLIMPHESFIPFGESFFVMIRLVKNILTHIVHIFFGNSCPSGQAGKRQTLFVASQIHLCIVYSHG